MGRSAVSSNKRNEDLFISAVEYMAKKYKIEGYTLITGNGGYHIDADSEVELEVRKELAKLFMKH